MIAYGDLSGTKNGSNVDFTIPVGITLLANSVLIIFNTSALYPVASSPGPTQCIISGTNVTLGLAPESTDNVWYYGDTP